MIRTKFNYVLFIVIAIGAFVFFQSCGNDYVPKPRAYFRIALPEKQYTKFDSCFPYKFEYPVYAKLVPDYNINSEPYWINIDFPEYTGRLHLSYKPIENNLKKYIEDSRNLANKHIPKANAINQNIIINNKERVFGLLYNIKGSEAASAYQFYLTDSTNHFVRGALYFNLTPNNDSLVPVIEFIEEDINHLVNTFKWK